MPPIETAAEPRLITGEEFADMPECEDHGFVEGRLVPMSPPPGFEHGEVEANFLAEIRSFVKKHKLGRVATGEVGLYTRRNPDSVRGADVVFISHERWQQRKKKKGYLDVAPELVVEVLSTRKRMPEMLQKIDEYMKAGVILVWVADPDARHVDAFRSLTAVQRFTDTEDLTCTDILPGFSVPIASLFEDD